jgi:predicted GNAT family acetyltransferase
MTIRDNSAAHRFEMDVGGQIVFAIYERRDSDLVIRHVEAPPALRGTGVAGQLMRDISELARVEGRSIVPLCGYALAWLRRHPQYGALAS